LWRRFAAADELVLGAALLAAACVLGGAAAAGVCANTVALANAAVSARAMNFFMFLISLLLQIEVGATQV
jgi:hypothetical protein